jgi:hypothetical protein
MADVTDFGTEVVKEMVTDSHHKNNARGHVSHQKVLKDVHCLKLAVRAMPHMFRGFSILKQEIASNFYTADV